MFKFWPISWNYIWNLLSSPLLCWSLDWAVLDGKFFLLSYKVSNSRIWFLLPSRWFLMGSFSYYPIRWAIVGFGFYFLQDLRSSSMTYSVAFEKSPSMLVGGDLESDRNRSNLSLGPSSKVHYYRLHCASSYLKRTCVKLLYMLCNGSFNTNNISLRI